MERNSIAEDREDQLLIAQKKILESVALGGDFQETLDELCVTSELLVPNSVCSVMAFDPSGQHLDVVSGPNLPSQVIDQLNGTVPCDSKGSCPAAVFRNAPVYVSNTLDSDRWKDLRELAINFNIKACWSHPVRNSKGEVIGSFAISSFETREPSYFQQQLLTESASIAGIILERRSRERELWGQAHQDKLTGLSNRLMFDLTLDHAISNAKRQKTQLGVLFVDLDNFKGVNDTHGHSAGDAVLREIARRLNLCKRSSDTLARYGGDEFVFLLENIDDLNSVTQVAQRVVDECAVPVLEDDYGVAISASVGISLFPNDALEPRELLSHADKAMYKAKSKGRNGFYFYEEGLTRVVEAKKQLRLELREGLDSNQFVLLYLPQFSADGCPVNSFETLIRWDHPSRGLLKPGDFLPAVEEEGFMGELNEWVLRAACAQAKTWIEKGLLLNKIIINFSLCAGEQDSCELIEQILNEIQLPGDYLELDVAESLVAAKGDTLFLNGLKRLRQSGVSVALDHFGVGGIALSLLADLPIDVLKMDRLFVEGLTADSCNARLIKMIIATASSLDLPVLAKRVETDLQWKTLALEGCSFLQGFLFSKPLVATDIENLLRSPGITL